MCVSVGPAHFSNTIVFVADGIVNGRLVHYLGYQNRRENKTPRPNCLVIPIPAKRGTEVGPNNLKDTSEAKGLLKGLASLAMPTPRTLGRSSVSGGVTHVFNSGSYTIVLSRDPEGIIDAFGSVPSSKRPDISPALVRWYGRMYPDHAIALCFFDDSADSEPLLWEYEPEDSYGFFVPAVDGHTGEPPDLESEVMTDHEIIFGLGAYAGLDKGRPEGIPTKHFASQFPEHIRDVIPPTVVGFKSKRMCANGDWFISKEKIATGEGWPLRVDPPGA